MEISYLYTKARTEFGKQVRFGDVEAHGVAGVYPTKKLDADYVVRRHNKFLADTKPPMQQSSINTERLQVANTGMVHREGGWPREIDPTDKADVNRFRKKAEKDETYKSSVIALTPVICQAMRQNNTVDIYQHFFDEDKASYGAEVPMARGLASFSDPASRADPHTGVASSSRPVCALDWHPDGPSTVAAAYAVTAFQDARHFDARLTRSSFIWDVLSPNEPKHELKTPSPITALKFNPKAPETLAGGCYNGLVGVFDSRDNADHPCMTSVLEHSHTDPVYAVQWAQAKAHNVCVTASSDGRVLFWDVRKISQPTDEVLLESDSRQTGDEAFVLGASCMEYNPEAGAHKFLVGTEQGVVGQVDMRNRKKNGGVGFFTTGPGKHLGPVNSIQRNPVHTKFFLTVGDWSARIWAEDLKTPVLTTQFSSAMLAAAQWSPTRPAVFFTARHDGSIEAWDLFWRYDEPALVHQVAGARGDLTCLAVSSPNGRLLTVGDTAGNVHLIEVSEGLAAVGGGEKLAIGNMLEREFKQEKLLEHKAKEARRAVLELEANAKAQATQTAEDEKAKVARAKKKGKGGGKDGEESVEALLRRVDAAFMAAVKAAEAEEGGA
mmetsp:Transcript_7193/g.16453  ORF Transcript_7193/g.16453 Transcript_7193/m.16453 type:complete len:608 (+) Transcript_7193:94-1917(+)